MNLDVKKVSKDADSLKVYMVGNKHNNRIPTPEVGISEVARLLGVKEYEIFDILPLLDGGYKDHESISKDIGLVASVCGADNGAPYLESINDLGTEGEKQLELEALKRAAKKMALEDGHTPEDSITLPLNMKAIYGKVYRKGDIVTLNILQVMALARHGFNREDLGSLLIGLIRVINKSDDVLENMVPLMDGEMVGTAELDDPDTEGVQNVNPDTTPAPDSVVKELTKETSDLLSQLNTEINKLSAAEAPTVRKVVPRLHGTPYTDGKYDKEVPTVDRVAGLKITAAVTVAKESKPLSLLIQKMVDSGKATREQVIWTLVRLGLVRVSKDGEYIVADTEHRTTVFHDAKVNEEITLETKINEIGMTTLAVLILHYTEEFNAAK